MMKGNENVSTVCKPQGSVPVRAPFKKVCVNGSILGFMLMMVSACHFCQRYDIDTTAVDLYLAQFSR